MKLKFKYLVIKLNKIDIYLYFEYTIFKNIIKYFNLNFILI